jgi:hypothetical protein
MCFLSAKDRLSAQSDGVENVIVIVIPVLLYLLSLREFRDWVDIYHF